MKCNESTQAISSGTIDCENYLQHRNASSQEGFETSSEKSEAQGVLHKPKLGAMKKFYLVLSRIFAAKL